MHSRPLSFIHWFRPDADRSAADTRVRGPSPVYTQGLSPSSSWLKRCQKCPQMVSCAALWFTLRCPQKQDGSYVQELMSSVEQVELEYRPMPNMMVALPNTGGTFCSTPQSLADADYTWLPCSKVAKTRKPLKLARVPQTIGPISAASRPKFTILWGRLEEILLLDKFFSDCRYVP